MEKGIVSVYPIFFTDAIYSNEIEMQHTIIISGFVLLLAVLIFFLYTGKDSKENLESRIIEENKEDPEIVKPINTDKKASQPRETSKESEPLIESVSESKTLEEKSLADLEGIGPTYERLLNSSGINSIAFLASHDPEELLEKIIKTNELEEITKRPPKLENIKEWVQKAKKQSND
jgi:predicted flap endonuclease-1-like 5' DNA nuclease